MTRKLRYLPMPLLLLGPCHLRAQTTAPTAPTVRCSVDRTPPSDADNLLEQEKYKEAEAAYRQVLAGDAADGNARLGVVRALMGQNEITEANDAAADFARQQPASGLAQVAAAEAAYRAGEIESSFAHVKQALQLSPCDGRTSLALARLYSLTGLRGRAATLLAQAHRLRPLDEDATEQWIASLPRTQRLKELTAFLKAGPVLSEDDTRSYANEVRYLEARKPDECHITSSAERTRTAMQAMYGDHTAPVAFGLDVSFNGKRRRMQIDTGAGGIVLTEAAAKGLGLEQEFHAKTSGVGDEGERDSYLAHVQSMRVGDVELTNCLVEVVSKAKLDVDGLIGMDVFRRWLVTLDYPAGQLMLEPLPSRVATSPGTAPAVDREGGDEDDAPRDRYVAPEMKDWLPVARIGHEILLPANLKVGGPTHYMIMDTGASRSTFALPLAKEAGKLHASAAAFHGISGKTKKVYETNSTQLLVGTLGLAPESYFAFDMTNLSHTMGFELGGLLGLPTLQRLVMQIDYRDNLLKLNYDPKRDRIRF